MYVIELLKETFKSPAIYNAFIAGLILALGCTPVGVFLVLRRMSLMGDALSHSMLPGVIIGFIIGGGAAFLMGFGGIISGCIVVLLTTIVNRYTKLREDAGFTAFYLIATAIGAMIMSVSGKNVNLLPLLFGNILSITISEIYISAAITTFTLFIFAIIYRPLVIECFDPTYMKSMQKNGGVYHFIFMMLVVMNIASALLMVGTLLAIGIVMLPAISARLWSKNIATMLSLSFIISILSNIIGLLIAKNYDISPGATIILVMGFIYLISIITIKINDLF